MPPVLAVLFWVWIVVSIVVLVKRRAARRTEAAVARVEVDETGQRVPEPVAEPATEPVSELAMAAAGAPAPAAPTPVMPTPPPGFEQPEAPAVDRPAPRSAPAEGIADALVGIQMPCDLVPLVFDRLATDKITLSTTGFRAEVVGSSLADEVERLGYVLRPLSDHEVLATRGATELRMSIQPPGPDGRHLHHPNARDDSVVVEITLF